MKREEIFEYVNKQYGSIPEYLWRSSPKSAKHPVEAQSVIAAETAETNTAQPDNEAADKRAAGSDNQN